VPSTPDLLNSSDSGISSTDDLTNVTTPTFSGTAVEGATVALFADGVNVGSVVAADGNWSITSSALTDGVYDIAAVATPVGGSPGTASPALSITIDTVAPVTVGEPTFHFATAPHSLRFAFSEDVGPTLAASSVAVQNITASSTIAGTAMAFSYDQPTLNVTFIFEGLPQSILADGNYAATLSPSITDQAGNALTGVTPFEFFFLRGDANRDRVVDISDLGILASNWQQSPRNFTSGDFNFNNTIEISDLGFLASNWQKTLPAVSSSVARPSAGRAASAASAAPTSATGLEDVQDVENLVEVVDAV
jgi:hypothetical protein